MDRHDKQSDIKPFGFCCSATDYDPQLDHGQRRGSFKSAMTPIQKIHEAAVIKLYTETIDSAEAERGKKQSRSGTLLAKTKPEMMMPSSSPVAPIGYYLEDEIALGRDSLWMERQNTYNENAKRNLAEGRRKTNIQMKNCSRMQYPKWYQDFSFEQMKNLACLEEAIYEDYEEMVTGRTQRTLMAIGVISTLFKLSGEVLRKLQKACQQDVIDFLREIYKMLTGNYFEDEGYKDVYDCNERIILTGIAFLTFPETVLELHRRLPPVTISKLPPKPQPPVIQSRKRMECPYEEELFMPPDWASYLNNLQSWKAYCKLIPIPKVILPDLSSLRKKRPVSKITVRDSRRLHSKTQQAQISQTHYHQRSNTPPTSPGPSTTVEESREISTTHLSKDITGSSRALAVGGIRRLSQLTLDEKMSEFVLDYEKYDIPRLPDENKVFNFTLSGLSEKPGPVEYKICGTMNPPQPHKKSWLGDKHAHYIILGAPNNPPTCPVTYEMTGVANVTPVNSDERFLAVLKIGDGPRKIYPRGRAHLSQNWQEWLQNADEEYKKLERQANKMIKDIEATMRLVFPGPTCDSCCSCRQTRKTHTKWKQTKAPYFVIDTVTEDQNKNKYIVGSLAMHSPAPSPAESTVNLLEVIASEDVLATNLIINGVTNEKGETQYFITGSKKSWMHIPSKIVEPPPPPPLRNVPPCACAIHQIFNKGLTPRMSGDNIPWTKDEGKCYGKKFRPDETGAYSCKMYPGDKSCRRNPFTLDIEKLKQKQAKKKKKEEKADYSDKDKKMYSIADFKPCGDEHGDPVCSGPWGEKNKWTREELAEEEKERKAILKGPPCGQKPGRAVCGGPFGARIPMEKRHAKIEEASSKDMSPEELAMLMAAEEEEEDEEEEEEEEEEKLPPPKKERAKIRDKGCFMSPESIAGRTKVVKKKEHKFIPDPNYHGYDDLWNIYRTAPTEEEEVEPEYEHTLKLSTPEARVTPKRSVKEEKKEEEAEEERRRSSSQKKRGSGTRLQKEKARKSGSLSKKSLTGKKGTGRKGETKFSPSRSTIQSTQSRQMSASKSREAMKSGMSIANRSQGASSERFSLEKKSRTGSSTAQPSKSASGKLSTQTRKSLPKSSMSKTKEASYSKNNSKVQRLKPRLAHTRIDRPSSKMGKQKGKKVQEAGKHKPITKSDHKSRRLEGKSGQKRSLSASVRSDGKSPTKSRKFVEKRSLSASTRSEGRSSGSKSARKSPSPRGRLTKKRSSSTPGKSDRKSRSPPRKLKEKRVLSFSSLPAKSRTPSPSGKRVEKWSANTSVKQSTKKKQAYDLKPRSGKEVSGKESDKILPRSKVPSYETSKDNKNRKRKKRGKREREARVLTEEERKQERERLKTMMKSPNACPIKVEPVEVPVEPRKPCKHEHQEDEKSVTPAPSVSQSETNLPKKGPCGWLTKSEQKLPVKKNLIYLADKDDVVDTIPVRAGGKACTCREMRNKKKQLMYNVGGVLNKEKSNTEAKKLLRRKKEEEEEKDTHVIEGAIYFTPPPSPRRSDEYVPEYGLLESPYDMCLSKRKDTNLRLIEQTAGPKGLTSNVMKMVEPCGCNDYIDSYGILDPDGTNKAKELEQVDKTRKELVEGRSTEERWYRAFRDAGLVDYFTRCKHNLPCWLKCSKFNKHGCRIKYRKLQIKQPVCECKYERKVLEHREEKVNWKKRQERLKSLKKQPYMSIVETSRPIEADTKLMISNVKRIPRDDEYIDDVKYCITGVAENYNLLPPQQVVDGMKMMTPVQTPKQSLERIPMNKGLHRHWSPVEIPAGPLPRKDAEIIADKKRRQEALEEAYRQIYAPRETRDPHGTHTCEATCNPEVVENSENGSLNAEMSKKISFMPGDVTGGKVSHEKTISANKDSSRSGLNQRRDVVPSDKGRLSKRAFISQESQLQKSEQNVRSADNEKLSISKEGENTSKVGNDLMKLAKLELKKMGEEGFVFAKLPESFKVPQLQDWLLYRKGIVYTEADKKNIMRNTVVMWNMMSTVTVPPIQPPPLDYCKKDIRNMTFANIEKVKKEIAEKKALFHSNIRKARVAYAHSLWDSMEYRKFPTKTFKEAYFTYLASKECDGHVFKPWFLSEVREKPRV